LDDKPREVPLKPDTASAERERMEGAESREHGAREDESPDWSGLSSFVVAVDFSQTDEQIKVRGPRFPWTPDKPLSWRPGDQGDEQEEAAQA